jgi:hypothetical protein
MKAGLVSGHHRAKWKEELFLPLLGDKGASKAKKRL